MPPHFITRERIHVDRISMAGTPFDVRGAELGHHGGRCTMEALIDRYGLSDEALRRMGRIVRAADLPHEEPAPAVTAGVLAIFDGVRDGSASDEERLERGFVVCDALYVYCQRAEAVVLEG